VRGPGEFKRDALGALLILAPLPYFYRSLLNPDLLLAMSTLGVFAIYGLGVFAFLRYLRWEISGRTWEWDSREILMITPLGQMVSTAASSGGVHWGVYEPWAMLIVILPIASPVRLKSEKMRATLVGVGAILLVCSANLPVHRAVRVAQHAAADDVRGPPVVPASGIWADGDRDQPVAVHRAHLRSGEAGRRSHGISVAAILLRKLLLRYSAMARERADILRHLDRGDDLRADGELQQAPPKWILYERQLDSLAAHERQ